MVALTVFFLYKPIHYFDLPFEKQEDRAAYVEAKQQNRIKAGEI